MADDLKNMTDMEFGEWVKANSRIVGGILTYPLEVHAEIQHREWRKLHEQLEIQKKQKKKRLPASIYGG